jgi:hypothetical protein
MEGYLQLAEEYTNKKAKLLIGGYDTVVLGSSHGNRCIDTDIWQNTLNLATTSQDLYQSYQFLKYTLKQSSAKNVVLFWGSFSGGYNIQHSSEKFRAAIVSIVFKIRPVERFDKKTKDIYNYLSKQILPEAVLRDYNPLKGETKFTNQETVVRAEKHRSFAEGAFGYKYLKRLIKLCRRKRIVLTIVIPPATLLYRKAFTDNVFRKLESIASQNHVKLVNLWKSKHFLKTDFFDGDHLNRGGGRKLTELLMKEVE